jgi:hypothetical protein
MPLPASLFAATRRRTLLLGALVALLMVGTTCFAIRESSVLSESPAAAEVSRLVNEFDARFASRSVQVSPTQRTAMRRVLETYVDRPDLHRPFPDPVGDNFDGLLTWAITDNDTDTTSLTRFRSDLIRLRLADLTMTTEFENGS